MGEDKPQSERISDTAVQGTSSGAQSVESLLFPQGTEFDDLQRKDLFEHYKLLGQNSEQMATRRQAVNSFFLSINTALIAANGVIAKETFSQTSPHRAEIFGAAIFMLVLGTIGLIVCRNWSMTVKAYAQVMQTNSVVAQAMEKHLLAAAVTAQLTLQGKHFVSITVIERNIAHAFYAIYTISMTIALYMIYLWHELPPQIVIPPAVHH
jgi:L-asparagine transporter-like permease